MSKKNQLADQLNAFSEGLKNTVPIKITPKVEITESEEIDETPKVVNHTNSKTKLNKKNKFKSGETVQMSIIIPKTLQKELKALSFKSERKVNTLIIEAIEKDLAVSLE